MSETPQPSNRKALVIAIPVLIILIPVGYSVISTLFVRDVEAAQMFLEMPDQIHTSCVMDTEYMRYHHWELLTKIREDVVRDGIRGEIGLYKCQECHTSRERFCNQCHNAVNLYPECFGCHYYP